MRRQAHTITRKPRCAQQNCPAAVIPRPAQRCGALSGGRLFGCGRYFCDDHLHADPDPRAVTPYHCGACFRPAAAGPVFSAASGWGS